MKRPLFALALAVAGLSGAAFAQSAAQAPARGQIGIARAVSLAEAAVAGKAFEAELDRRRAGAVYEVGLVKNGRTIEAEIDAVSGKLLGQRPERRLAPWSNDETRAAQAAPRTLAQTIAMVETATKGKVLEIGLDRHAGRHVYEVELAGAQDRDIWVDVRTGAITPKLDD